MLARQSTGAPPPCVRVSRRAHHGQARGSIGGLEARLMREVVERAPLDWLIHGGSSLADLFGGLFDRR